MSGERPLVACPACGRTHPGHVAGASGPHYCSIACYRTGHGLNDPATGDGRRWCGGCRRYFEPAGNQRFCSDACRVADWRRRQPQPPPSPPRPQRAANIDAVNLDQVMTEHAPARYTDHASATLVDDAVYSLATVRGLQAVGDAGATLHALASLAAQIDELLPTTVTLETSTTPGPRSPPSSPSAATEHNASPPTTTRQEDAADRLTTIRTARPGASTPVHFR